MADVYDGNRRLKNTVKKIQEGQLSEENIQAVMEFKYYLDAQGDVDVEREVRILDSIVAIDHLIDFNLKHAQKEDVLRLIGEINHDNWDDKDRAAYTIAEYRKAVKKFYQWHTGRDEPEITDFISCYVKKKDRPRVQLEELPRPQEVTRIMDACMNTRDKALVITVWETGGRISEVLNTKWKDITELENFHKIKFRHSKTMKRSVPVKDCIKHLKNWKQEHANPQPEEYIFTNLNSTTHAKYRNMRKQIEDAVKRTGGIERRTNFHAFRKSRASYLAANGWNIFQLMKFFGWSDPQTAIYYIRLARSNVEEAFMRTYRQSQIGEFSDKEPEQEEKPEISITPYSSNIGEMSAIANIF